MILELPDLQIFGIYDRGLPNKERIVLRVNQPVNLAEYFLILGFRGSMGANVIVPITDHSLWLGSNFINVPGWVFIFTGSGNAGLSQEMHTKEPVHTLYWNRPQVLLEHNDIIPALIHIDYVDIGNQPNKTLPDLSKKPENTALSDFFKLMNKAD